MKFHYMHIKVQFNEGNVWYLSVIYGIPNMDNRRLLWEELKAINSTKFVTSRV